jgi:hypothetical protein
MKNLFNYLRLPALLFGIAALYSISSALDYTNINLPVNNSDSLITEEMLLLDPQLQGTFKTNNTWPGLTKINTPEIGIQSNGFDLSGLSVWGSQNIGKHSAGLLLTGFDRKSNTSNSYQVNYYGDSLRYKEQKSNFSIYGKTYLQPFLPGLLDGISGECYVNRSSSSSQEFESNSSNSSRGLDTTHDNYFSIHLRGVHVKKRFALYADWWANERELFSIKNSTSTYNKDSNLSRIYHSGCILGLIKIVPHYYTWRISLNYEHILNENVSQYSKSNSLAIDGAFIKEKHYGPLTQYYGMQLRLSANDLWWDFFGCKLTLPLLLKYTPVPHLSLYSSCKLTVDLKHNGSNTSIDRGNSINSAIYFSPLSFQWSPSKHHDIVITPMFSSTGVFSASLEWRIGF